LRLCVKDGGLRNRAKHGNALVADAVQHRVIVEKAGHTERLPGVSQLQDHVGDGLGMRAAAEDEDAHGHGVST